jgi:hypothetical protein
MATIVRVAGTMQVGCSQWMSNNYWKQLLLKEGGGTGTKKKKKKKKKVSIAIEMRVCVCSPCNSYGL